jgi:hypothetical protein
MTQNKMEARCERCGCTFDTADSYAYVNYASVASDHPSTDSSEFNFGLCGLCEIDFNKWLDRGK